jgi:NADH dehydrogenase
MRILVTGGAGEIGSRLVVALVEGGHQVHVLVLPDDPGAGRLEQIDCRVLVGDITRPETLGPAFEGVQVVYHLAAVLLVEDPHLFSTVNVEGTRNVVQAAAQAGVEHMIHVSSASVIYPDTTHYSRSKREGERVVRSRPGLSSRSTIVRPTLVYDGEGGLEFALFVDYLRRYPVVPLIGDGRALKNPVHVEDLIDGLAALAGNPRAYGKTYNLCGGEVISIREMAELLLRHHGMRKPLVPVPLLLCRAGAALLGRLMRRPLLLEHTIAGLTQDADLDRSAASRDLGYAPVGIREGLTRRPSA